MVMYIITMDTAHLSYIILDIEVVRIKGDSSRWDDKDKLKHRSAEWDKKYLYGTSDGGRVYQAFG